MGTKKLAPRESTRSEWTDWPPGEWEAEKDESLDPPWGVLEATTPNLRQLVASVWGPHADPAEDEKAEAERRARLIARAPWLLAIVEKVLKRAGEDLAVQAAIGGEALAEMRMVVAQAKGEKP